MELIIKAKSANIEPSDTRKVKVIIDDAEGSEILGHFKIQDIIDHFGTDEVLTVIGQEAARDFLI